MRFFLALAPTISFVVYGQLMLKWRVGTLVKAGVLNGGIWERLVSYLIDPIIVSGYVAAFLSSLSWMIVVERYALSLAFPVYIGMTVFLVTLGSVVLLEENLNTQRIIGIFIILLGVILCSQSQ